MTEPRIRVEARWVSEELLTLAADGPRAGRVTARFESVLHAELDGFVVAVVPAGAPRMPNGVSVAGALTRANAPQVGDPVVITREGLRAGALQIGWSREHRQGWDARVVRWSAKERRGLRDRARAILGAAPGGAPADLLTAPATRGARDPALERLADSVAGASGFASNDGQARPAVAALLGAVRSGDPDRAACAARELAGRGPGLTPAGDDVLAATALTVAAAAPEFPRGGRLAWLAALVPPDLRRRTTSVSATLLELAVRGRGIGPARELLDPRRTDGRRLRRELAALRRLGHTSGASYAATIGAVALVLAPDENHPNHDKENR